MTLDFVPTVQESRLLFCFSLSNVKFQRDQGNISQGAVERCFTDLLNIILLKVPKV